MAMQDQRGFSLVEMMVGLLVVSLAAVALTTTMLHSARLNRAEQMSVDVQGNARSSIELIVSRLRSAGWDPLNAGIATVAGDPDPSDDVSQIEIFADHDEDGVTESDGEQVLIRHVGDRIEWRLSASAPFSTIAAGISNDADGDGVVEPMFELDDAADPTTVTVQVTATSAAPDPRTGEFTRYTLTHSVALRNQL